jgi:ribosome-associated translation inhibitor RaiA
MEILLTVGRIYQLYTKYESIAGEQVKIVGTLAYSEIEKVPYNVTVLAINERVIAVKDEDLEERISGDTIYHCRAVTPKPDGTYSEYIVWDSIINREKTIRLNENYQYILNISIADMINSPITQIISDVEKYISKMYPGIQFSIAASSSNGDDTITSETGSGEISKEEDKHARAEAIIEALIKLEYKLIPAAKAIIDGELINKLDTIIDNVDTINSNVQIIANNV